MKNICTKIFTGIFLAVLVAAFGVSSVFADDTSTTNATPATGCDDGQCQGKIFNSKKSEMCFDRGRLTPA